MMMKHSSSKLIIPGKLHGLNDCLDACKIGYRRGSALKRADQDAVEWLIRSQLRGVRFTKPVYMIYRWFEPDRRRDKDNISSFGRKVIQDALVNCRIIKNDGWRYIEGFEDHFYVDSKKPRIEVEIIEQRE